MNSLENLENLTKKLDFIENESNYYSMFNYAYDSCVEAKLIAHQLFREEILSDEEFVATTERISSAKKKMLEALREWTVAAFERSTSKLTKRQIVFSVFSVIFNNLE